MIKKTSLIVAILLSVGFPAHGVSLFVYTATYPPGNVYIAVPPFISWSQASIQQSIQTGSWVGADEPLLIQTDQQYHQNPPWGIQIFTDNEQVANAASTAPPFSVPDYRDSAGFHNGSRIQGPLTPKYRVVGSHSIQGFDVNGACNNILPQSGLVGLEDKSRLPLVWEVREDFPDLFSRTPVENPNGPIGCVVSDQCNFNSCTWFFMPDKGDKILLPDGKTPSNWKDGYWYNLPFSQEGMRGTVCSPAAQTAGKCSGPGDAGLKQPPFTTVWVALGANFRNATRQKYQTTVFVELYTQ